MTTLEHGARPGELGRFLPLGLGVSVGVLAAKGFNMMRDFAAAERKAGREEWPFTATMVGGIPADAEEASVMFPGLGSVLGEKYAKCVESLQDCPSGYVQYSSEAVDHEEIAEELVTTAPKLRKLHIRGHSMGGRHGLEVARLANKMTDGQITVSTVTLYGSPYEWPDVRNKLTAGIVVAAHKAGWEGGPRSKKVVSTVKNALDVEGFAKIRPKTWKQARLRATADAKGGICPRNYPKTLSDFKDSDPPHLNLPAYAPLFGPGSRARMFRPARPGDDRTVLTDVSSPKWGGFFGSLGVDYEDILVPGMDHANVAKACEFLREREEILKTAGRFATHAAVIDLKKAA